MDRAATPSPGQRRGSGVVGPRGPGPHRLSYKVHSNEKHTGGLRFLTEKARRQLGEKHIFPPQGNDCCMQSLLLLKEAGMRRGRLIAVLTSSQLRWDSQCNQFCPGQFYYFPSGAKLGLSGFTLALIVACDSSAQTADQGDCWGKLGGDGIIEFWWVEWER